MLRTGHSGRHGAHADLDSAPVARRQHRRRLGRLPQRGGKASAQARPVRCDGGRSAGSGPAERERRHGAVGRSARERRDDRNERDERDGFERARRWQRLERQGGSRCRSASSARRARRSRRRRRTTRIVAVEGTSSNKQLVARRARLRSVSDGYPFSSVEHIVARHV